MPSPGLERWAVGNSRLKREILAYGLVGLSATASYLAFSVTFSHLGASATFASFMSYVLSTPVSYFGHRRFTFQSDIHHRSGIPRFAASLLIGFILSISIPYILNEIFGFSDLVSFFTVAAAIPTLTFFVLKIYVFRRS